MKTIKLSEMRQKKGLSIYRLAQLANVSYSYLYEIEHNPEVLEKVSWHTADKIAAALGVPLEEIFPQFRDRRSPILKDTTKAKV